MPRGVRSSRAVACTVVRCRVRSLRLNPGALPSTARLTYNRSLVNSSYSKDASNEEVNEKASEEKAIAPPPPDAEPCEERPRRRKSPDARDRCRWIARQSVGARRARQDAARQSEGGYSQAPHAAEARFGHRRARGGAAALRSRLGWFPGSRPRRGGPHRTESGYGAISWLQPRARARA